jgi:hypothetical protein
MFLINIDKKFSQNSGKLNPKEKISYDQVDFIPALQGWFITI